MTLTSPEARQVARPSVSVIMPVYNTAAYVGEAISSVIQQTYGDWELIAIDDCSSDNSKALLESAALSDARIRMISLNVNSGAAVARNCGIEAANGQYIAFLDSDDMWNPNKLERQIEFMQAKDCAFSYSFYEKIFNDRTTENRTVRSPLRLTYKDLLKSNQIGCLTAMYDSSKIGKYYMPSIRKRQDYGLWLSILKQIEAAYGIPEVLARYRIRKNSISSKKYEMIKYNWHLYHKIEKLNMVSSGYYLMWNVARKVFK